MAKAQAEETDPKTETKAAAALMTGDRQTVTRTRVVRAIQLEDDGTRTVTFDDGSVLENLAPDAGIPDIEVA